MDIIIGITAKSSNNKIGPECQVHSKYLFYFFFFCWGNFSFKYQPFSTARSDGLTGLKVKPDKNSGFSHSLTECSKTVEFCIISSGTKKDKKTNRSSGSSRSVLSFLILCHHVLQTSRDDDGWRDRQEKKTTKDNRKEKHDIRIKLKIINGMWTMLKNISVIIDVLADGVITQFSLWQSNCTVFNNFIGHVSY